MVQARASEVGVAERPARVHGHARRWAGLALTVYLISMLWLATSSMRGPIVYEDEHGPIETARTLIGQQAITDTKYYPGHALLLVPSVAIGETPLAEYRLALATNVVLMTSAAVTIFSVASASIDTAPWKVALAVGTTFSIPYVVSSAALIWSEASLIAIAVLLGASIIKYARSGSTTWLLVTGAGSGLALLFHPRLIAAVPAALVGIAAVSSDWKQRSLKVLAAAAASLIGILLAVLARNWIIGRTGATSTYDTPLMGLGRGLDLLIDTIPILLGRMTTDVLALVALPVIALVLPSSRRALSTSRPVFLFGISLAALLLIYTAASMAASEIPRPDFLYYTRYQGPGTVVMTAVAAIALARDPSRGSDVRWRPLAALAIFFGVSFLSLSTMVDPSIFTRPTIAANIPELAVLGSRLTPGPVLALVAVTTGILLLIAHLRFDKSVLLVSCLAVGLTLSAFWLVTYAYRGSIGRSAERQLVTYMADLDSDDCVIYDNASVHYWNRANYEFFSDAQFIRADADTATDCGSLLLVGPDSTLAIDPEAVLMDNEASPGLDLYLLPSMLEHSDAFQLKELNQWYELDGGNEGAQAEPETGFIFGSGWQPQAPSEEFKWSDGSESNLHIQLAGDLVDRTGGPFNIDLDIRPLILADEGLTSQRVLVSVNGIPHDEWAVVDRDIFSVTLDPSELGTSINLTFSYPNNAKPCELTTSGDCRSLAIGMYGLLVRQD